MTLSDDDIQRLIEAFYTRSISPVKGNLDNQPHMDSEERVRVRKGLTPVLLCSERNGRIIDVVSSTWKHVNAGIAKRGNMLLGTASAVGAGGVGALCTITPTIGQRWELESLMVVHDDVGGNRATTLSLEDGTVSMPLFPATALDSAIDTPLYPVFYDNVGTVSYLIGAGPLPFWSGTYVQVTIPTLANLSTMTINYAYRIVTS